MERKFHISHNQIAVDFNGTTIFEGTCRGRPAAIKRIPLEYRDKAIIETKAYQNFDNTGNIVRCLDDEVDDQYHYIVLERANCNLLQLIQACKYNKCSHENENYRSFLKTAPKKFKLWNDDGDPSPILSSLINLINPENILIFDCWKNGLRAKLSNFSFDSSVPSFDIGTQGWRCPERLNGDPEDTKSDSFGLGLITHLCLTGLHPFGKLGNLAECEKHIKTNLLDLSKELTANGADFVSQLLNPVPIERPDAWLLPFHPMFWNSTTNANFLCEVNSMMVGLPNSSDEYTYLVKQKHLLCDPILGWHAHIPPDLILRFKTQKSAQNPAQNPAQIPNYVHSSLRDLLRMVRNVFQHHDNYEDLVGPSIGTAYDYVLGEFGNLIVVAYNIVKQCNRMGDKRFESFFS